MLTVIFISHCEEPALSRTREILDAYAKRIGDCSWETRITQIGLNTVKSALCKKASRKMAVCCHIITRKGRKFAWIVGNRRKFARDGGCAIRMTGKIHDALKTRRNFQGYPLVAVLAEAAAKGHDFGKANQFFQEKIKKSLKIADPLRHEFLSALLAKKLSADNNFENAWKSLQTESVIKSGEAKDDFPITFPRSLAEIILWLIASHHRLPHWGDRGKTTCENHVNIKDQPNVKDRNKNLQLSKSIDEKQINAFKDMLGKVSDLYISEEAFASVFMWTRMAIMLADHFVSSDDQIAKVDDNSLAANSKNGTRWQKLEAHLDGVARMARKAAREIVVLNRRLPALYPEDRRELERSVSPSTKNSLYLWQNDLSNKARTIVNDTNSINQGFVGVLCADTGTGKTRAGILLASILGGENMRVSVLFGLRTLTLQSDHAYVQDCKIPRSSIAVLIGSKETKKLHELENQKKQDDGDDYDNEEFLIEGGDDYDNILPQIMEYQCKGKNDKKLVCAPVLVATIDYLMKGADWRYSRHLLPQLRLLTSDVILDEIDSYDLNDYPALARLCYLVGLFGRKLILSSATTMPEIFEPLFITYNQGWQSYAALAGADKKINLLFAADCVKTEIYSISDYEDGNACYCDFADRVANQIKEKPPLRIGNTINIQYGDDLFEVIYPHILSLHVENSVNTDDELRVSAGLIRLAHTNEVADLSIKLAKNYDRFLTNKIYIKVIPYHSRMVLIVRNYIERNLDRWLKRKCKNGIDEFISSEFIQETKEEAKKNGCSNVVLIVVATPVEEIGRDHDFDWAIIEPSSTRSIVQCAGRVNRHRRKPIEKVNIMVLSNSLRYLNNSDTERKAIYQHPGFERKDNVMLCHDMNQIGFDIVQNPTSSECLIKEPSNKLTKDERRTINETLKQNISQKISGAQFYMTDSHLASYEFRASEDQAIIYFDTEISAWRQFFDDQVLELNNFIIENHSQGFYIEPSLKNFLAIVEKYADELGIEISEDSMHKYLSVSVPIYLLDGKSDVIANPILGIYKKKQHEK